MNSLITFLCCTLTVFLIGGTSAHDGVLKPNIILYNHVRPDRSDFTITTQRDVPDIAYYGNLNGAPLISLNGT